MMPSEMRQYSDVCDPLATLASLRNAGVLGDYSYFHLSPNQTEIGWAPVERLQLLAGEPCDDWRDKVAQFARRAEELGRKAFGYIGFDAVSRHVGTLPDRSQSGRPLVEFIIPGETVTFTSLGVTHRGLGSVDLSHHLASQLPPAPASPAAVPLEPVDGTPEEAYLEAVRKGVVVLSAGEAHKLVLSRYQAFDAEFDPVAVVAALQPPFVDIFLICFGDLVAVVSSPELLISGTKGQIVSHPLAGTRVRGSTPEEDERLRTELLGNHKEIVEHVVSVQTVLADLETVCPRDSLVVSRFMEIFRLPKVQHLASIIRGTLDPQRHILEALWALFPAVTVTGLPRSAAIEIVNRLEPNPRYMYGGVMGWVSGAGDCRFSLVLRGLLRCGGRSFLQAGAGILAESVPEAELRETSHKLSGMREALAAAVRSGRPARTGRA